MKTIRIAATFPIATFPIVVLASWASWSPALAEAPNEASYTVRFNASWSQSSHPIEWPEDAHFSRLVGGVHSAGADFWQEDALASEGIKDMAERGRTSTLSQEVQAAVGAGTAREVILGGAINPSPGAATAEFTVSRDFPLATVVTMVAPSPDWFTGVDSINLFENGNWVEQKVFTVYAWDAGTDSGDTFDAADAPTSPRERIHLLESQSFRDNPVGTFVFTRKSSPGGAPLALNSGRFLVRALWEDFAGTRQYADAATFTDDSGYFWFFDPENVELVVKVLDGCGVNQHFWVFAAGLTNVRVEIEVYDTVRQRTLNRTNELGTPFAPIQDTLAFPCS